MDREQRQRLREIQRRRGHNVNEAPEVRAAWQRCRALSLAYLDAVIEAHASGCPGAVPGWGKYAHLSPPEQVARQEVDYRDWVRHMEDTPWFPGRTLGHAAARGARDRDLRGLERVRLPCAHPGRGAELRRLRRRAGAPVQGRRHRGRLRRRGRAGAADRRRHGPLRPAGGRGDPAGGAAGARQRLGAQTRGAADRAADLADPRLGVSRATGCSRTTGRYRRPSSPSFWPVAPASPSASYRSYEARWRSSTDRRGFCVPNPLAFLRPRCVAIVLLQAISVAPNTWQEGVP